MNSIIMQILVNSASPLASGQDLSKGLLKSVALKLLLTNRFFIKSQLIFMLTLENYVTQCFILILTLLSQHFLTEEEIIVWNFTR